MSPRAPSVAAGLMAAVALLTAQAGNQWTYYGEAGPDHWSTLGFSRCSGERQSPINVVTNRVVTKRFKPITFSYFDQVPLTMNLSNNYHSANAQMTWEKTPMIEDGGLLGRYEVVNFHFHWGKDDFKGSEHTIDGESYPLEMHVVCKNTQYTDLASAVTQQDGLAVLGVMYESAARSGRAMRDMEPALHNITAGGATIGVQQPPRLLQLLPWNTAEFYRYNGSLTTPGCHEAVTWTVFTQTLNVTEQQLSLFRALQRGPVPIGSNYRPPQRRHGRSVFLSYLTEDRRSRPTDHQHSTSHQAAVGPASGAGRLLGPVSLLLLTLMTAGREAI